MSHEPRILVVDDDPLILRAVGDLLRKAGFRVATHASGFGLAITLRDFDPDVVLLDVDMPGLRGDNAYRVATHRHLAESGLRGAVILFSGLPLETLEAKAQAIGASAIVQKPMRSGALVETIHRVLAGAVSSATDESLTHGDVTDLDGTRAAARPRPR